MNTAAAIFRNFKALPIVYKKTFKFQPEDGFMKTATCSCYVILIKNIVYIIKSC